MIEARQIRALELQRYLQGFTCDGLILGNCMICERYRQDNIYIILEDNNLLGFILCKEIAENVKEITGILGNRLITKYARFLIRKGRDLVFEEFMNSNIHRLQITIPAENEQAIRCAELIGFKKEGLMRKYINKKDYWLMAII